MHTLGLRASLSTGTPNYAGYYLAWNFLWSYGILQPRFLKMHYDIDNNVMPRNDIETLGPEAVKSGKLTQSQLDLVRRNNATHENSVAHFPAFVGAILWGTMAGLSPVELNASALAYTLVRLGYSAAYLGIQSEQGSWLRTIFWWSGNIICIRLWWIGTKAANAALL